MATARLTTGRLGIRHLVLAVILLAGSALVSGTAAALEVRCAPKTQYGGDWPMMHGDLQSDRWQRSEATISVENVSSLTPVWAFDANRWTHTANNEVTGYPVEADGCVFVGSSRGVGPDGRGLPGWVFAMNADNGDVVWQTRVDGGVHSTVAVSHGVVYAFVSRVGSPFVVALESRTGRVLWQTTVDHQLGSDAVSSPVVYDGLVWVGVSGRAAETSKAEHTAFQGSSVLLAARPVTAPSFQPADADRPHGTRRYRAGEVVRKIWSVPPRTWAHGDAGGSQWGTIAVDPETGYAYEGTGNRFDGDAEHPHTNAVLKLDLDRSRRAFGQVVASYKGDIETKVQGPTDAHLDLGFGATPNIVRQPDGRKVLVVGQKSGAVHIIDAASMRGITKTRLGTPSPVGGMVGSAATDGRHVYGAHAAGGYLYSIATDGTPQWVTPVGDGVHWGPPVTLANGLLYTVDLKGFLDVYDAATGAPALQLPMNLATAPSTDPTFSWAGVTVARNTVYASVGVGLTSAGLPSMPNGYVIAYQPVNPLRSLPGPP